VRRRGCPRGGRGRLREQQRRHHEQKRQQQRQHRPGAQDTLARLRSWLGNFSPSFIGLRGTIAQIETAAREVGVPVGTPVRNSSGTYSLSHGTEMLAYATNGTAYESFFPSTPPASTVHDLKLLVTGHHP
jgi:protein SCO1